jgi:hypothetical protein
MIPAILDQISLFSLKYCPLDIAIFDTGFTPVYTETLTNYCPLDTSTLQNFTPTLSQTLANYCPLDTTIFN